MSKRRFAKENVQRLAQARIEILWDQALQDAKTRPEQAKRMMQTARRVAQRARIKIPRSINRRICKQCGTILIPGTTCRVRVRQNRARHVVVTCTNCGGIRRFNLMHSRSQA